MWENAEAGQTCLSSESRPILRTGGRIWFNSRQNTASEFSYPVVIRKIPVRGILYKGLCFKRGHIYELNKFSMFVCLFLYVYTCDVWTVMRNEWRTGFCGTGMGWKLPG